MSLVAYASSEEESGAEEEEAAAAAEEEEEDEEEDEEDEGAAAPRGLLAALPPPGRAPSPAEEPPARGPLGLPRRRPGQPVRIPVPALRGAESDSEEDEPAKKRSTFQGRPEGSGLSALLPQPKNLAPKESNRLLLPSAFARRSATSERSTTSERSATSETRAARAPSSSRAKAAVATTPSPSAIKAAAKSAALQVTKQMTQEDNESDEDVEPDNFFSLGASSEPSAAAVDSAEEAPPGTAPEPQEQDAAADAPLEFRTAAGSSWAPGPGEDYGAQPYGQFYAEAGVTGAYYQDYYGSGYYPEPAPAPPQDTSTDSSFLDDEAFKRLQGKRNRGREEINFVDIKGDDQLSGAQQWLTKSLSEEKTMKSFSKRKGDQPTGQQRRKHQITYLIHQAKERELELKNTWSENKLSRRQTQAKYGF